MANGMDPAARYRGPAFFSQGIRPFFFGASLWAAIAMLVWIGFLSGSIPIPGNFGAVDWHIHSLLFGYVGAVIGGFLLTAIPNWTGRFPLSGWRLAGLFAFWAAGRLVLIQPWPLPAVMVAAIDLSFPMLLIAAATRELIAGDNRRNLRVLALVVLFGASNALFHWEVWRDGAADLSVRLGLSSVLLLILLVGGRVVPSFTRNWLAKRDATRLPAPFGRFDMVTIALSALALLIWTSVPDAFWTGTILVIAGLLNSIRIGRWAGGRTLGEPLVAILHLGFAFVPLGFLATGMSVMVPGSVPANAALHSWTAGAIGLMTMAIMTRASLGHTGGALIADRTITAIYVLLFASSVMRMMSPYANNGTMLLNGAAGCWIVGFCLFIARFVKGFFLVSSIR